MKAAWIVAVMKMAKENVDGLRVAKGQVLHDVANRKRMQESSASITGVGPDPHVKVAMAHLTGSRPE
jgi:hypothetical protein